MALPRFWSFALICSDSRKVRVQDACICYNRSSFHSRDSALLVLVGSQTGPSVTLLVEVFDVITYNLCPSFW